MLGTGTVGNMLFLKVLIYLNKCKQFLLNLLRNFLYIRKTQFFHQKKNKKNISNCFHFHIVVQNTYKVIPKIRQNNGKVNDDVLEIKIDDCDIDRVELIIYHILYYTL